MATSAVQFEDPPALPSESKSQRKKKAKAEAANTLPITPAVPNGPDKEGSSQDAKADLDSISEHPQIKELAKQIRSLHKKLSAMSKLDQIVTDNPGVSLDELVTQRKINADQKSAIQKKPQLQTHLLTLEDQIVQHRKLESEYQSMMQKQREDLTSQHRRDVEKVRNEARAEGGRVATTELREKILIFSQFLRCAAAKRTVDEEVDTDESKAFEGALLLVYGGDQKAVDTAMNLIEGSGEQVPSIEGVPLPVKYAQIHQASIEHAPFKDEENWVDSVAEARGTDAESSGLLEASAAGAEVNEPLSSETPNTAQVNSDPTIAHAGLTELDTAGKPNGVADSALDRITSPPQANAGDSAGNIAGDRWDTAAPGADKSGTDDSYEMISRPQDELEVPDSAAPQEKSTSWADEPPAPELAASSNQAGEGWDSKAPGDQTDNTWSGGDASAAAGATGWTDGTADITSGAEPQTDADGFHQVGGRNRGRGRGRGDGEFRGRGRGRGGYRGDGEFRGRGRGGFRGRGDGEFRGRGGRGRGPRGAGGVSQTYDNA